MIYLIPVLYGSSLVLLLSRAIRENPAPAFITAAAAK